MLTSRDFAAKRERSTENWQPPSFEVFPIETHCLWFSYRYIETLPGLPSRPTFQAYLPGLPFWVGTLEIKKREE